MDSDHRYWLMRPAFWTRLYYRALVRSRSVLQFARIHVRILSCFSPSMVFCGFGGYFRFIWTMMTFN